MKKVAIPLFLHQPFNRGDGVQLWFCLYFNDYQLFLFLMFLFLFLMILNAYHLSFSCFEHCNCLGDPNAKHGQYRK